MSSSGTAWQWAPPPCCCRRCTACSSRRPSRNGCWPTVCRRDCSSSCTSTSGTPAPGACEVRAVVLLSGGLDSFTAAAIAKSQRFTLFALTIDYGQRHAREIESARAVARALGIERHLELDLDLRQIGGSSLTTSAPIPHGRDVDAPEIPSTYVPARNT